MNIQNGANYINYHFFIHFFSGNFQFLDWLWSPSELEESNPAYLLLEEINLNFQSKNVNFKPSSRSFILLSMLVHLSQQLLLQFWGIIYNIWVGFGDELQHKQRAQGKVSIDISVLITEKMFTALGKIHATRLHSVSQPFSWV